VPPCTQKAFLILATMKGRITARTLSFTTQLCSSSEILFPEVILRCKLPPSKSTIWKISEIYQGQERCRLTYDSLYAISLHTQPTKPESLVASVKICTTHSTLELIQRGTHNYHDWFHRASWFPSCALHTRERKPRITITLSLLMVVLLWGPIYCFSFDQRIHKSGLGINGNKN